MELTYFLAVHGLAGDSTDIGYRGWFNVSDFDFGILLEGRPDFKPLEITLPSDAGLAGWLSRAAAGQITPSIVIEGVSRSSDGANFVDYKLELANVIVNKIGEADAAGYQLTLGYEQIRLTTIPRDNREIAGNPQVFTWNLSTDSTSVSIPAPQIPAADAAGLPTDLTYFLAVHGLAGDSADNGYRGWFNVSDFDFGILLEGRPDFKPLEITLPSDTGLVGWLRRAAAGQITPSIVIEGVFKTSDARSLVVHKLELANVSVDKIAEDDEAGYQLSLDYEQIRLTQTPIDIRGIAGKPQVFTWNLATNSTVVSISAPQIPADAAVTLTMTTDTVTEDGAGNLIFTFTRTGSTANALDVNYTVSGTATLGIDYTGIAATGSTKTVSFEAGSSSATVIVDPIPDRNIENDETVEILLAPGQNYNVSTTSPVTGIIANDDSPVISLSASPPSVLEDGLSNLIYSFSRTGPTDSPLTVNFSVGGTAVFGLNGDYTQSGAAFFSPSAGTITFPVGAASTTMTIDPFADTIQEGDETVALTLVSNSSYIVGTTSAVTGTIRNDDPRVSVTVTPSSLLENSAKSFIYTFSRTGSTKFDLVVNYSIAGGATSTDYKGAAPGSGKTITIPSGFSSATLAIQPVDDRLTESNEAIDIILASGKGYFVGPDNLARAVIANDDFMAIGIGWDNRDPSNAFKPEGNSHGSTLRFRLTRSGNLSEAASVDWALVGTGLQPVDASDFEGSVLPSGNVVFQVGEDNVLLEIKVAPDREIEANETFVIQLSNASANGTITTDQSRGSIQDDDFADPETLFVQTGSERGQINGSLIYDLSARAAADPITSMVDDQFSALLQTEALFHNLVGLYRVVNSDGAIVDNFDSNGDGSREDLLNPGDQGYAYTAIANRVDHFELQLGDQGAASSNTSAEQFGKVLLNAGDRYAPFMIANGGTLIPSDGDTKQGFEAFLALNPTNEAATLANYSSHAVAYFGFAAANPDGSNHLASRGGGAYGFEDLPGNLAISDFDFNDACFQFRLL